MGVRVRGGVGGASGVWEQSKQRWGPSFKQPHRGSVVGCDRCHSWRQQLQAKFARQQAVSYFDGTDVRLHHSWSLPTSTLPCRCQISHVAPCCLRTAACTAGARILVMVALRGFLGGMAEPAWHTPCQWLLDPRKWLLGASALQMQCFANKAGSHPSGAAHGAAPLMASERPLFLQVQLLAAERGLPRVPRPARGDEPHAAGAAP